MEVDELFQKLVPILGKKSKALWLEYVLNPESRQEIEGLLRTMAAKHLNHSFEKGQIVLVPPNAEVASGEYPLGTIYYGHTPFCHFGIRENEWIQHMAIFGRTGSGKTNVGFLVTKDLLEKQKPFLIFDWKRNYRDLVEKLGKDNLAVFTVGRDIVPFSFNPLIPPTGTTSTIWLKKLIEIMCHVYWLGEGVAYLLQKAIDSVYREFKIFEGSASYPTLDDVHEWLENYKAKRREAQWMDSTLRAISTLCYGDIGKVLNSSKALNMEEILRDNIILELDALTNSDKTFLIESIMLWIHHYRLQQQERETFKHAIVVEEAHHILLRRKESKESVMDIILREIRELGEAIILIDQHPSLISIPSIGNTYCTVAMNLKHGRDINTIGEALLLTDEQKEYLSRLPIGYGIVKLQSRHHRPFLVKFPFIEVKKGSVMDEQLKKEIRGYLDNREVIPANSGEEKVIRVIQTGDNRSGSIKLDEKERELLEDIVDFPIDGIADRFRRLNITAYKGYKILRQLLYAGFIQSNHISTPQGRVRFLQFSEKGRRIMKEKGFYVPENGGGPEHEYWKYKIAEILSKAGYIVEFEKPINGHRADLVATRGVDIVAVEVESGKSDAIANIKNDLASEIKQLLCLALSSKLIGDLSRAFTEISKAGRLRIIDKRLIIDDETSVPTCLQSIIA